FDRRGSGASDPLPLTQLPPWESYVEEIEAVMEAAEWQQAAIMGLYDAGPAAALFAATKPERTTALILAQTTARWVATDDYPIGIPPEVAEQVVEFMDAAHGSDAQVLSLVPSRATDERFRRWFAKLMRSMVSPAKIQPYAQSILDVDARTILPLVQAPTLVLHRTNMPFMPIA